jgi:hypothetical protein
MKNSIITMILFALIKQVSATSDTLSLKEKVEGAELVFEGRVIADSSFMASTGFIYTAEFVLISKEFKGYFPSDIMIVLIRGGKANGMIESFADAPAYLKNGNEGIFFCNFIDPESFSGIKKKSAYWVSVKRLGDGFIKFFCGDKIPGNWHRARCVDGTFFDDVQKEIYEPIEQATGEKYKQLRPNCLEQNKAVK